MKTTKMVRYNGQTETWLGCSSPKILETGKIYQIIDEEDQGYYTYVTLKGVPGKFNSCWFNLVSDESKFFTGFIHELPQVGGRCTATITQFKDNRIIAHSVKTSEVKIVEKVDGNIYKIYTRNSCYILQLI